MEAVRNIRIVTEEQVKKQSVKIVMIISGETEKLLEEINEFSEKPLINRFEVSFIIESFYESDKKFFNELIFSAKYVHGLKNVLAGRSINKDDYMKRLYEEFNKALERFISLLREVILEAIDSIVKFFDEKYFKLSQNNMVNVMILANDLSMVKEYFNSKPKGFIK